MAKTDTLDNEEQLAAIAGIPDEWLNSNSEIRALVEKAIAEGWLESTMGQQFFIEQFLATQTYKDAGQYLAGYLVEQDKGGEGFRTQQENARNTVRAAAVKMGAELTEQQISELATNAMMYGWTEPDRAYLLDQALTGQLTWTDAAGNTHAFETNYLNYGRGNAATNILALKEIANKNGVSYTDDYFQQAATSIASGLRSIEDFKNEIREQAASLYPAYADKIRAGFTVKDLASPYVARMAKTLEISEDSIDLDNQYIKQALLAQDDKGDPTTMNLWDFEKMLRATPEWGYTKAASDKAGEITSTILRMFTGVS